MDLLKLDQSLEPKIMSTAALIESAVQAATAPREPKDIEAITRKLFLKNLLTLPPSSSAAALLAVTTTHQPQTAFKPIAPKTTTATTTTESMITKEINDAQLNLTKILYEPEEKLDNETKEKDHELASVNDQSTLLNDSQLDDDDQMNRLVIDISDDEKKEKRKKKATKEKNSTTSAEEKAIKIDRNQLPKSITYNLETTTSGISSSVKIDILASNSAQSTETAPSGSMKKSSKNSNITVADELNLLGHEIDRQMSRKTNEILELIKAYISNTVTKNEFHDKMNEIGNVSMSDLTLIARKVIKRYKFEQNPNQQFFAKMRFLQFPTSGTDLINYFENLLPTLSRDKFINMIKFYEIIIKEMLNLNRTKILQYLIDFMVKKKNSQLDLLNFNYLASTGYTAESNASQNNAPVPEIAQQPPSEKKPPKFFDTSYNFVLRSDPIYIMACSKFHTIIRNVIRCRCSSCIQINSFERRPFDNNILRNRRIGKRLVNEREDLKEVHAVPEKIRRPNEGKNVRFLPMPTKIQNSSPILVSDTPPPSENSSPPVIHSVPATNVEKPRIIHQYVLQRAFSERPPVTTAVRKLPSPPKELPKLDFPQITPETPPIEKSSPIKQPAKRRISAKAFDPRATSQASVVVNGETTDITLNELKTLSDNGTEIIPSSAMRNSIASRRKTVDERAQVFKTMTKGVEVRKIAPVPQPMSEPIKPTAESAHKAMMKRRQSCHERIFANTVTQKVKESNNLGQNYINFLKTQYENKNKEEELKMKQMQQAQNQLKCQEAPTEAKRVRFEGVPTAPQNPTIVRPNAQYIQPQPQVVQHQMMPRAPAFYEQHQKFVQERIFRERFYDQVEQLQDRDQSQNNLQQNLANQKATRGPQQRTPVASDEKMRLVAFQQLQSLHESSTIGLQQYAEHLKQLHQYKQTGYIPTNAMMRPNSQEPPREGYYQNTQQQHSQGVATTTVAQLQHFYQPTIATTTVTSSTSYPISSTDQSLQKKLKLKSKTLTNYVEPNQAGQPFYNPPHSTYYADPYAPAIKKTPPIPTSVTAFHPTQVQVQAQVERRNPEMHVPQQQFQNFWMLQQQQHQQQINHQPNPQPNIARPIPISRGQNVSAFLDPQIQNAAPMQAFHHNQSEYYRQYYQHHHPKSF